MMASNELRCLIDGPQQSRNGLVSNQCTAYNPPSPYLLTSPEHKTSNSISIAQFSTRHGPSNQSTVPDNDARTRSLRNDEHSQTHSQSFVNVHTWMTTKKTGVLLEHELSYMGPTSMSEPSALK